MYLSVYDVFTRSELSEFADFRNAWLGKGAFPETDVSLAEVPFCSPILGIIRLESEDVSRLRSFCGA